LPFCWIGPFNAYKKEGRIGMRVMQKTFVCGLCWGVALFILSAPFNVYAQEADSGGPEGTIKGTVNSPWIERYQALIYIDHVTGEFPPPKKNPHMSQRGLVFQPHILPVLKGTSVDFTNDDTVSHNVFSPSGSATPFNLGIYGPGVKKTETFNAPGVVPLLCIIHPDMSAFVIVLQNPYFALTREDGSFEIDRVPPGTYQLKLWDEKLKTVSEPVTVKAGKTATVEFKNLTQE
jgi:plastocyanin